MAQNSPPGHHRTTLSGYIFANKACIDNRKKLLNSNTSSTCIHNMANFGPVTSEIGSGVWDTRANFDGSVTARHSSSERQPNFAALNKGRHLFGRAAITLGIGSHSSSFYLFLLIIVFMAALCNRGAIIFLPCSFFPSSFFHLLLLLFFPRLISATVDRMSAILLHMVWP